MNYSIILLIALLVIIACMYFIQSGRKQLREEQLIKEIEELRLVLRDQQELLEEERQRIGQDLHDDLAQLLAGTRLALENLRLEPTLSGRNRSLLLRIDHDLNDLLNRVQNIIWNLAPESLREKGLSYAIWKMCDHLRELRSFHIEYIESGPSSRFTDAVEVALFRIVQEIVNNAMRHSLAWNIKMKIHWTEYNVRIEVKDDGVGRERTAGEKRDRKEGGRGLNGMKRRAKLIGATVATETIPKGTMFVVSYAFK